MDKVAVNVPLLRKVLEHITEHPEEWDQGAYAWKTSCGTAFCVAGHAVVMAGHELKWESEDHAVFTTAGRSIGNVAAEELGLDGADAYALFKATNSLDRVWELAGQFTNGEITRGVS